MPRARPIHQAQRAIADLTVKSIKATKRLDDWYEQMGLAEVDQQFQVDISGVAYDTPAFVTTEIAFDFPFHYAPGQRDSDLERPHFTYGTEVDGPAMLTVSVTAWEIDAATGAYIGATVQISALSATELGFNGKVHLNFQGVSAADEVETTDLES